MSHLKLFNTENSRNFRTSRCPLCEGKEVLICECEQEDRSCAKCKVDWHVCPRDDSIIIQSTTRDHIRCEACSAGGNEPMPAPKSRRFAEFKVQCPNCENRGIQTDGNQKRCNACGIAWHVCPSDEAIKITSLRERPYGWRVKCYYCEGAVAQNAENHARIAPRETNDRELTNEELLSLDQDDEVPELDGTNGSESD